MNNISTLFGQAFNAAEVEPSQPYSLLPRGRYVVAIDESAMKETKSRHGQYLECRFRVLEGEHQESMAYARFNLINQNPKAQEIAFREFSGLCRAVGVLQVADSHELHDRPLVIQVDLEVRKDGGQIVCDEEGQPKHNNVIKGYFAINDARPGPTAAPAPTAAPRPTAPMPPPAAARTTSAKPGAPAAPWKRSS